MPMYEGYCPACDPECRNPEEHYYPLSTSPEAPCSACGGERRRLVSQFAVVFTGVISTSKYGDPRLERYNTKVDGHQAWRRRSSLSGKPEPVWIETFEDQKRFCREEGLTNPKDVGPMEIGDDGKSYSTRGMPGCW